MVTPMIGLRIPDWLLEEVEAYGKENFPKDGQWEKTATLLSLIQRGLQSEGISVNEPVKYSVNRVRDISSLKEEIKEELKKEILNDLNDQLSNLWEEVKVLRKISETKSKAPPEEKENLASDFSKLVEVEDQGLTASELALKHGLKRQTVESWLRPDRNGIPTKGNNAKYSELYEIRDGKFYPKKITGG